jgi:hypothetical protein
MNTLSELLWPALLGIACGVLTFALLTRRHTLAQATKTARCVLSTKQAAQTSVPLDTHLCLNVLGRFAIALDGDESAQQGMEHLGDYLAACHRAARARDGERLAHVRQVIDHHWSLARWREGRDSRPLAWHVSGEIATQQGMLVLVNALQHQLDSQGDTRGELQVHVDITTDGVNAEQQVATLSLRSGADAAADQQPDVPTGAVFVRWPLRAP